MNSAGMLLRLVSSAVGTALVALTIGVVTPVGAADKADTAKADTELVRPFKIKVES